MIEIMEWLPVALPGRLARSHPAVPYLIVVGSVTAATVLRLALGSVLGSNAPYATYFVAVSFSAWLLGLQGGVACTVVSAFAADYFFIAPLHSLHFANPHQIGSAVVFVLSGLAISALGQAQFAERIHAEASASAAERTAEHLRLAMDKIAADALASRLAEQESDARARRASALNRVGKAIRETRDPLEVQYIALQELAETLHVDRCLGIVLDRKRDLVSFVAEWHRPDLPDLRGEYSLANFDIDLDEIFSDSKSLVVHDVDDRSQLSSIAADMLKSLQIKALLDVPMSNEQEVVGVLGVCMADGPRQWSSDEVLFVEAVASQLRAATEAGRVLTDAQNRASQEALINRIGAVMRMSLDPDVIQEQAVTLLGQALAADRCYFALYDLINKEVIIGRDWHRPDLPSVHGVHRFVNTAGMFNELYPSTTTSVIRDRDNSGLSEQTIKNMAGLQLRSRLSAAVADSRGMATLTAAMSDGPRDWMPEEIELVEKVASLLRSGVEMARVQLREHRIATDLQAALMPALPDHIPGLTIGACMQPALDEAQIGGDFVDVFCLDKELYALVIGDVSGKGLAAAAQLATVRNSLRTALYLYRAPSEALRTLNTIMTVHDLLIGFVTLFVGVYDVADGSLAYSSCGHEPALVRRQIDDSVETLCASDLPLGVSESAGYAEKCITLNNGDALLMYTDGVSEAGPSRSKMLDTKGVIRVFTSMTNLSNASEAASDFVDRVKTYANGVLRDDACVLLACRHVEERDASLTVIGCG